MSGGGFHVHGPRDHELEHAAKKRRRLEYGVFGVISVGLVRVALAWLHI